MKCAFCGHAFEPAAQHAVCRRCSLFGRCKMIKCPQCGYETPPEPRWLRRIIERWRKHDEHPDAD